MNEQRNESVKEGNATLLLLLLYCQSTLFISRTSSIIINIPPSSPCSTLKVIKKFKLKCQLASALIYPRK